jgi:hypothetical protein
MRPFRASPRMDVGYCVGRGAEDYPSPCADFLCCGRAAGSAQPGALVEGSCDITVSGTRGDWGGHVLSDYFDAAMKHAAAETLLGGSGYARLPRFPGSWAAGPGAESCRQAPRGALEDGILIGLRPGHPPPVVDGLDLSVRDVP